MKVAEKIETRINKMPDGNIFKYQGLAIAPDEYPAAAKAIERLIKKGLINRSILQAQKDSIWQLKTKGRRAIKALPF